MQLAEMRAARQRGEDEPELRRDLMTAKDSFDGKRSYLRNLVRDVNEALE